ncbi:PH-like domain-containing protein [Nocardioides pakistanensis]
MTPLAAGAPEWLAPVLVMFALLGLAYVGMWRGWRARARRHDLPPLPPAPPVAELPEAKLQAGARYFGTTVSGNWLERVTAQGLGARSSARLSLSPEGIDVIRLAGSFRIPAEALRGARHDQGIAGKVVPPHGVLVVTWQHGDLLLDTGFRLEPGREGTGRPDITETHNAWVRSISKLVREHKEHTE